jgi:hypothetical protein
MALADDIQMAERHVLQAERHIKYQRAHRRAEAPPVAAGQGVQLPPIA